MKNLSALITCTCSLVLVNPLVVVATSDNQGDVVNNASLRLVRHKRLAPNDGDPRDLMNVEDYLWKEKEGDPWDESGGKRRKKRTSGRNVYNSDSKGSKSSKSKGGSDTKGSKGSKSSSSDSSSSDVKGRVEKDPEVGICSRCCQLEVYEFFGQTGTLIAQVVDGVAIENELFAQYVIDGNVFDDIDNNSQLSDPAVFNTGKCTQVRFGRACEFDNAVCCEGLTNCDIQYSLSDDFGSLGDIVVSGGLTDGALNILPIVGGNGAFQQAYGEVELVAVYDNPDQFCNNISGVSYYNIAAKIYVEDCQQDEHVVYYAGEKEDVKKKKRTRKQKFGW